MVPLWRTDLIHAPSFGNGFNLQSEFLVSLVEPGETSTNQVDLKGGESFLCCYCDQASSLVPALVLLDLRDKPLVDPFYSITISVGQKTLKSDFGGSSED